MDPLWLLVGGLLLWLVFVFGGLLFLKRKDKPRKRNLPFVPLDGKHPELEAEQEWEKTERMAEMRARVVDKFLSRF